MFAIPPELVLHVLSFLPIRSILFLRISSRAWYAFISQNEASVYHAAAILHGFAEPHKSLEDSKGIHVSSWIEDVTSWKGFCHRHFILEMSRIGRLPVRQTFLSCLRDMVHRFKIDEEQGTIIATHMSGGLSVASIVNDYILWSLAEEDVRRFAHCEFGHGFLIFDRSGPILEVWRRKRDSQSDPLHPCTGPDAIQERTNNDATQRHQSILQDDRGAFVPFTVICPPHPPRAYRFVYPTLLVASQDAQEAYLFDIPTGQLQHTVSLRGTSSLPLRIEYVELSTRHVFVCTEGQGLLIFSRHPDTKPSLIQFHPGFPNLPEALDNRIYRLAVDYNMEPPTGFPSLIECTLELGQEPSDDIPGLELASAVHVSPCGSHLVCVGLDGFLYIIRDFSVTLGDINALQDSITIIAMRTPITHMAFEEDRIAFYAANAGLYFIPFASPDHVAATSLGSSSIDRWPRLYQASEGLIHTDLGLDFVPSLHCSCVQMNSTGLWYVPAELVALEDDELFLLRQLRYIDFTVSLAQINTRGIEHAFELAE